MVLRSDRSLGVLDTSKRTFVYATTAGKEGLYWAPGPVLSDAEKTRYEAEAKAMVDQGRAGAPTMLDYRAGQTAIGQMTSLVVAGTPWSSLRRMVHWVFRSRRRAFGSAVLVTLVYFMLEEFGIFAMTAE